MQFKPETQAKIDQADQHRTASQQADKDAETAAQTAQASARAAVNAVAAEFGVVIAATS